VSEKKILVIDDDKDIHAVLRALFGREYKITSAFDAVQGGIMARQGHPDIIILDINLPGGGGEKVYQRLRKMTGVMNVPILVYTGLKREEIEPPIVESDGTVILFKPAAPEAIAEAVHKLLPPS
jgi:two-component system, OmpR family, copper resistance phosphate regulon response regulator CusR